MQEKSREIHSITKAVKIIDLIASRGGSLALGEIAQSLGWSKSTTHGIVSTLVMNGFLEQSQNDGRYLLGIRLFEIGSAVSNSWDITKISGQHIQHLALATGESAFVSGLSGKDSVLIDKAEILGNFKVASPFGSRSPLFCNSQGKVLLAYMTRSQFQTTVKDMAFMKFTPHTTSTVEKLSQDCEEIKKQGYCVEKGEYRMGLCSIAAPVYSYDGSVKYAVGIAGMFQDIHSPSFQKYISSVISAANSISYDLGYRPQSFGSRY